MNSSTKKVYRYAVVVILSIIIFVMVRVVYEIWSHMEAKLELNILDVVDASLHYEPLNYGKVNILYKTQHDDLGSFFGVGLRSQYCIACIDCNNDRTRSLVILNPKYHKIMDAISWGEFASSSEKKAAKLGLDKVIFQYSGKGCGYEYIFNLTKKQRCCGRQKAQHLE